MAYIEVEDISFSFSQGITALKNIHFSMNKGELTVIAGRNGSGKSVLLRCLNGLYTPKTGTIRIDNVSISKKRLTGRSLIGLVFQDADSQIVGQTVERDIAFGLENLRVPEEEMKNRIERALVTMGLENHRHQRPHTLSGGEKRRLTIAGILAMEPMAIALDEPFSNLDYPGVKQVLERIIQLKESGHTIIVVTHDVEKLLAHADTLILMDNGSIAAKGLPQETLSPSAAEQCGVRIPPGAVKIEDMSWLKD